MICLVVSRRNAEDYATARQTRTPEAEAPPSSTSDNPIYLYLHCPTGKRHVCNATNKRVFDNSDHYNQPNRTSN